ncbi:terminase large subunit from bacteriophage origin, partial [Escherichia coli EC1850]
VGSENRRTSGC